MATLITAQPLTITTVDPEDGDSFDRAGIEHLIGSDDLRQTRIRNGYIMLSSPKVAVRRYINDFATELIKEAGGELTIRGDVLVCTADELPQQEVGDAQEN